MTALNFLVHLEAHAGSLRKPSREALGEAVRLARAAGGAPDVALLAPGARALAAGCRGARRAYLSDHPIHETFHLPAAAEALAGAARASQADVVLLAATSTGRELAAALAADLGTAVAADVVALAVADGVVTFQRPVYAGKAILTARFRRLPAVVTLRPNMFAIEEGGEPAAEIVDLPPPQPNPRCRLVQTVEPETVKKELTEADIVVSGGRGLKGPENFPLIESLAGVLGAAVGASRAVCDAGWRPHTDQVGQTGKTVAPRLYVACGISGAIQHLAGMSSSKCIVAINKDPKAPIFQVADYGIVGDLFEVVPALEAELRRTL